MFLFAIVMWLLQAVTPSVDVALAYRIAAAVIICLLGAFFCIAGVVSFRRAKTTVNPLMPNAASSLVTSGIYRYSRNPMYVGFALFLVAFSALLGSPWSLLGVFAFVLYMNRFQIEPEERALVMLFGEEFVRYKESVRRWV
jgi:protein-S-isoprenylcysteine O-methyltransferase Ste14